MITDVATEAQRPQRSFLKQMSLCVALCSLCLCGFVRDSFAQAPNWPNEFPPRPLPARSVNFPPYRIETLPNGLQVIAVLHHEQPAVSMRLLVRAGSAADPKAKTGLAHLTAALLDQGTATQSATEFNDAIDFIGGAVNTGAGSDLSYANMVVMKDSFDNSLRMLSDMVRHPSFADAEIARQRQQLLSSLQVSFDDPDFIANAVFDRLVYGFHPYGMPQSGTPETLASITRADLVAFHQKYFVPNNAILAIVGDVTAEEAFASVRRVFGDWERREVPAAPPVEPPIPTRRVVIVNKPDAVQTEVRVGHIGIPRNHPDYMAVNLAIRILGGEGSNRLHQVLRTARGLTYGAQADFDTYKESGDFQAETNTRTAATGEVLRLIVDEFWRLQRDRVSERELSDAKAYLTGSFPLTIETPNAIAMQILNVVFFGLPIEQLQTFRDRVNAVSVDDVQRVARLYLKPDRLSVVLVGNASAFTSQLQGVGFPTFETVDLGTLDLTAVDFKGPGARPGAGARAPRFKGVGLGFQPRQGGPQRTALQYGQQFATRTENSAAKTLLDRVAEAMGGLEKLRGVRTVTARQIVTTPGPSGPVDAEATSYIAYPNQFRVETKIPDGLLISAFDGSTAWTRDPQATREAPQPMAAEAKSNLQRDVIRLLVGAADGSLDVRALQDARNEQGRNVRTLELSSRTMSPIVLSIDAETMRVTKEAFAAGPGGQALVEESFSDYRAVDGVQMPFMAERHVGPITVKRRVLDIQLNRPLEPSLFKRSGS
jgi:zinc protease